MTLKAMEKKVEKIKLELQSIGDMRPGSLNKQYTVCGIKGCICSDPEKPKKHGPYWQLSYSHQGKSTSQFIQNEFVKTTERQLKEFKRFKALSANWIDLALKISKEKLIVEKEILNSKKNRAKS